MRCALLILFACLAAAQLRAHHGPVGAPAFYDTDELMVLEGTLTEVFWRNPHVRFGLRVVDESGEDAFWELESGVPSQLESGGFTAEMFPVGSHIRAAGFVSRHRDDFLGLQNMLLPNGLEYAGGRRELLWAAERLEPEDVPPRGARRLRRGGSRCRRHLRRVEHEDAAQRVDGRTGLRSRPQRRRARRQGGPSDRSIIPSWTACPGACPSACCRAPWSSWTRATGSSYAISGGAATGSSTWTGRRRPRERRTATWVYSVGRWESDDVLIVDTALVNYPYFDRGGMPQSDRVAFEEQFTVTLADGEEPARLGYRLTATDPVMYVEPLVIETAFDWSPRGTIETSSCEPWERPRQGDPAQGG